MGLLARRTVTIPIYQGDDLEILADLRRTAERARRAVREQAGRGDARHGDAPSSSEEEAAYNAAVAKASERAVMVTVNSIGKRRFRKLMADHPVRTEPRDVIRDDGERVTEFATHPDDEPYGVNTESFGLALLTFVDPDDTAVKTITAPELTKKDLVEFLENDLDDGPFTDLWANAYSLNRAGGADPKVTLYSTEPPSSP